MTPLHNQPSFALAVYAAVPKLRHHRATIIYGIVAGQGNEEMAEIVNLNRYRKARNKERARADAEENRVRHGRTKVEKRRDTNERDDKTRSLDGARLEDDGPEST